MPSQSDDLSRKTIDAQAERIRMLERQLDARTAALDAATHELAALRAQARRTSPAAAGVMPWKTRLRMAAIKFGARVLPKPAKQFIKKFWNPWAPLRRVKPKRARRAAAPRVAPGDDYDIVCFPIIDWSFRWQRPQQLLSQFADAGYRVFVIKPMAFLEPGGPPFDVTPLRDNVWEVTIAAPVVLDVYSGRIPPETARWFPTLFDAMRRELDIVAAVSIVQIATWREVAEEARQRYGWPIVYDCMDEWDSFPGLAPDLSGAEERLVGVADLVTVSAQRLLEKWRGRNARVELVRNAADFAHFTADHPERLLDDVARPIAGYFGAVAQWFDVGLLARVAAARPHVSFVVIGGVFDVAVRALEELPNVRLLGQQPYANMPAYLRDFDVCLIPFVVDHVTAATDPVKFYEYLAQGKPVVSTWMPELEPHRELLYLTKSEDEFLRALDAALVENDATLRERRVALARENTWTARAQTVLGAIAALHPKVSIVVISYGNAELTRGCIESVLRNTLHPNFELIVIDNASTAGSAAMLRELRDPRIRVILNDTNVGFAAANNQGLRMATGEYLVLLNNDTVVPRGWLTRMLRHLADPEVGIGVAVTNFSGNESRIAVPYDDVAGMPAFAQAYMREHEGRRFDIRVAAMYCVGMRREVFERVGPLDEAFGLGMFEDDDYSHRVRLAGLRVVCMEDVFVHHYGQASFSKLDAAVYDALWKRNQEHFETKWGMRWQPHQWR